MTENKETEMLNEQEDKEYDKQAYQLHRDVAMILHKIHGGVDKIFRWRFLHKESSKFDLDHKKQILQGLYEFEQQLRTLIETIEEREQKSH